VGYRDKGLLVRNSRLQNVTEAGGMKKRKPGLKAWGSTVTEKKGSEANRRERLVWVCAEDYRPSVGTQVERLGRKIQKKNGGVQKRNSECYQLDRGDRMRPKSHLEPTRLRRDRKKRQKKKGSDLVVKGALCNDKLRQITGRSDAN